VKVTFIVFEWVDIHTSSEWSDAREEPIAPAPCLAAGILFKKRKRDVVLVGSITADGDYGNDTAFPIGVVGRVLYRKQVDWKQRPGKRVK
jgi:hypothetical protein